MFSHRIHSPLTGSARSGGRWVGLGAAALIVAGVSLVTSNTPPVASAADCHDAEVVFARGTDEPAGMGRVGDAFVDSLRSQTNGMDIGTYAVNYKASKLQLHGGDGAKDAISHIKSTASSCPDTQIVLGGYSQGASVIDIVAGVPMGGIKWGDALPSDLADNVAAVATFGDVATRTGEALPTQSTLLGSKAIDLCNPADPICHAGPGNEWKGHTDGYIPAYTTQAAAFVADKLLAATGQSVPGYGPQQGYGPDTGYGPDSSGYGPQQGYGPQTGYGPDTSQYGPGYGVQPPGSGSSTSTPTSPSPDVGLVSAVH